MLNDLVILTANVAIIGIFAKVAMYFDKWWIILFSILVLAYRKN